jgi:hypothetical protein
MDPDPASGVYGCSVTSEPEPDAVLCGMRLAVARLRMQVAEATNVRLAALLTASAGCRPAATPGLSVVAVAA